MNLKTAITEMNLKVRVLDTFIDKEYRRKRILNPKE